MDPYGGSVDPEAGRGPGGLTAQARAALAALVVLVGQEVLARPEGLVGPAVGLVVLEVLGVGPVALMMRAGAPVVLAVLGVGPVALTMRGVALEVLEA